MPNCTWFGTREDHRALLEFIFAEGDVDVWELASQPDRPLRQLHDPDAVLALFDHVHPGGKVADAIHLKLDLTTARTDALRHRRSVMNDGHWRDHTQGHGWIPFYPALAGLSKMESSTDHTSQKWVDAYVPLSEQASLPQWDLDKVGKWSARLNRFIRKQAVARLGSRAILPEAFEIVQRGGRLVPQHENAALGVLTES